jgi:UDP-N-acetylmuramoylalanine--D-glutamate ligase
MRSEACLRSQERPIVLIAGGKDKQLDYTPLRAGLNGQVRAMVFIGEIAAQLEQTFGDLLPCKRGSDMAEAVSLATQLSQAATRSSSAPAPPPLTCTPATASAAMPFATP